MQINRTFKIPKKLEDILEELTRSGAKPLFVGGCVRDVLLDKEIKDFDIEVFGIKSLEELKLILEKFSTVKDIGKFFGVLKLNIDDIDCDFSIPRVEKKSGNTHKSFKVKLNSNLKIKKAAKRRDFTINSIYFDYGSKEFFDPYFGIKDLKNRKIKHIDDKSFVEDSLRVYRAIGFASRFDFKIIEKTQKLLKKIVANKELENLPKERVFEELKKLLLKSKKPSIGLKLLDKFSIFPISFENSYDKIDKLAKTLNKKNLDEKRILVLYFSLLLKNFKESQILDFLHSITDDKKFISYILILCSSNLENSEIALKKLSLKLVLEDLIYINIFIKDKEIKEIVKLCKNLDILNKPLKPHIMGVDLLNMGFTPSVDFRNMLDFALDLQITQNLSKNEISVSLKRNF